MPVAEDPGYLPPLGSMVPNDQEFGLAEAFTGCDLAEGVMPLFDGPIPLDRKNRQASRRKHALEMTAHILARFLDVVLPRPSDTTLVVVELDVWIQITGMLFKLIGITAVIERAKEFGIQLRDGAGQ